MKKQKKNIYVLIIAGVFLLLFLWMSYSLIRVIYESMTLDIMKELSKDPQKLEEFKLKLENRGIEYNEENVKNLMNLGLFIGALITIALGSICLIIAIGLYKMKNWARIFAIVISYLYAGFFGFISLILLFIGKFEIRSLIEITLGLIIGTYLLTSKDVKKSLKVKKN